MDHVWLEDGKVQYHVIGNTDPRGLCGSGLLDLVAVLLDLEIIDESGRMEGKRYTLCDNVTLTQKDVRDGNNYGIPWCSFLYLHSAQRKRRTQKCLN